MNRVFLAVILCFSFYVIKPAQVMAQSHTSGDPYLMGKITNQMSEGLNDIPVNIRRVAVYKINYSALRFTAQEVEFIRAEVEFALRQYAGLIVLSPPELEPNDKMKIMGSDSTLQILNIRGRSLADVSPEFLSAITDKYGVQGLIELTVQRRNPEGLVLSIRMMNPVSREVVWARSFVSNTFEIVEEVDKGQTHVFTFGAGNRTTESLTTTDTLGVSSDSVINDTVIDFQVSYTFRQPLHKDNSAYIGLSAGIHLLKSRVSKPFDMNLFEFGVSYYQAITQLNEDINEYRVMFFLSSTVQVPIGSQKGEMFVATPGIMFNLSENIGLSLFGNITLSGETFTLENTNQVTFNKTGYGVQGVIRF